MNQPLLPSTNSQDTKINLIGPFGELSLTHHPWVLGRFVAGYESKEHFSEVLTRIFSNLGIELLNVTSLDIDLNQTWCDGIYCAHINVPRSTPQNLIASLMKWAGSVGLYSSHWWNQTADTTMITLYCAIDPDLAVILKRRDSEWYDKYRRNIERPPIHIDSSFCL